MLQYKLRTLLLAMVVIAVGTWILFVLPDPAGVLVLSTILMTIPGIVTAGIVYCHGSRRAFCIGAAPMQVLSCLYIASILSPSLDFWPFNNQMASFNNPFMPNAEFSLALKILLLSLLGLTIASGAGAMVVHHMATKQHSTDGD